MRIRSAIVASIASGAILLIGWQAGTISMPASAGKAAKTLALPPHPTESTPPPSTPTRTAAAPSAPAAPAGAKSGDFSGSAVQTPYGVVQVKVVIAGGRISNVIPLSMTDVGSLSTEIDNQAVPMLKAEVLTSQTAQVNAVSGATYTSQGYLTSLQAALDAAHFTG